MLLCLPPNRKSVPTPMYVYIYTIKTQLNDVYICIHRIFSNSSWGDY